MDMSWCSVQYCGETVENVEILLRISLLMRTEHSDILFFSSHALLSVPFSPCFLNHINTCYPCSRWSKFQRRNNLVKLTRSRRLQRPNQSASFRSCFFQVCITKPCDKPRSYRCAFSGQLKTVRRSPAEVIERILKYSTRKHFLHKLPRRPTSRSTFHHPQLSRQGRRFFPTLVNTRWSRHCHRLAALPPRWRWPRLQRMVAALLLWRWIFWWRGLFVDRPMLSV